MKILLTEFDSVYVTHTEMNTQDLTDHLAENLVSGDNELLKMYFLDEEVNSIDKLDVDSWKLYFDGEVSIKGKWIGLILISPTRQHNWQQHDFVSFVKITNQSMRLTLWVCI